MRGLAKSSATTSRTELTRFVNAIEIPIRYASSIRTSVVGIAAMRDRYGYDFDDDNASFREQRLQHLEWAHRRRSFWRSPFGHVVIWALALAAALLCITIIWDIAMMILGK